MLVPSLLLLTLLASPSLSLPARVIKQRVPKFKNFPIVGLKTNVPAEVESLSPQVEKEEVVEEHPRDARQVEPLSYSEEADLDLDNVFVEEAVYLPPEAREQRNILRQDDYADDSLDGLFDDLSLEEQDRAERDGGHHHGASHHAGGRGQRGGRHHSQVEEQDDYDEYDYAEPAPARRQPEQRRGRQSGATGVALGVLSNPPSSDGNYNFNFSNDDGSSRQEVGAPDAIRGSYSFVTPEGEEVSVQYHADETGFHATGSHVPQAPPMPAHVQRLLDHLAKVNGLKRL